MKKLFRSKYNKIIAGVFGGLGYYLKIDPTIIRLVMIFVCIFTGIIPLVIIYLIAVLIIPQEKNLYPIQTNYRKLCRSIYNRKIAGICGGFGEFTKIDPVFLRLLFVFLCIVTGVIPLILIYFIGWIIIPEAR